MVKLKKRCTTTVIKNGFIEKKLFTFISIRITRYAGK